MAAAAGSASGSQRTQSLPQAARSLSAATVVLGSQEALQGGHSVALLHPLAGLGKIPVAALRIEIFVYLLPRENAHAGSVCREWCTTARDERVCRIMRQRFFPYATFHPGLSIATQYRNKCRTIGLVTENQAKSLFTYHTIQQPMQIAAPAAMNDAAAPPPPRLAPKFSIATVQLLPTGEFAMGGWNGSIDIWNLGTQSTNPLGKHGKSAVVLTLKPNGDLVSGSDGEGGLTVWDPHSQKQKAAWKGHRGEIVCLTATAAGRVIAGYRDGVVGFWESDGTYLGAAKRHHTQEITDIHLLKDDRVVTHSLDKSIIVWNYAARTFNPKPISKDVSCFSSFPDCSLILGYHKLAQVDVINLAQIDKPTTLRLGERFSEGVYGMCPLPKKRIALTAADAGMEIWDLATQAAVFSFSGSMERPFFHPGGALIWKNPHTISVLDFAVTESDTLTQIATAHQAAKEPGSQEEVRRRFEQLPASIKQGVYAELSRLSLGGGGGAAPALAAASSNGAGGAGLNYGLLHTAIFNSMLAQKTTTVANKEGGSSASAAAASAYDAPVAKPPKKRFKSNAYDAPKPNDPKSDTKE